MLTHTTSGATLPITTKKSGFKKILSPGGPNGQPIRWFFLILLRLSFLLLLLMLVLGLIFKNKIIFYPIYDYAETPQAFRLNYEELWLETGDGIKFKAWHVPAKPELSNNIMVLMLHGNGGNMSIMTERSLPFHARGFAVLMFDYPGFGHSEGSPSEKNTYKAAESAWLWVTENQKVPAENIIIYGFSLGGGVASWLAANHQPGALILDSTFTKLRDVPGTAFPWLRPYFAAVLGNAYDTESRLKKDIHCPLLVLHSPDDTIVPFELGERLFQTYENGPKEMAVGNGNHLDFILNIAIYFANIKKLTNHMNIREKVEQNINDQDQKEDKPLIIQIN